MAQFLLYFNYSSNLFFVFLTNRAIIFPIATKNVEMFLLIEQRNRQKNTFEHIEEYTSYLKVNPFHILPYVLIGVRL